MAEEISTEALQAAALAYGDATCGPFADHHQEGIQAAIAAAAPYLVAEGRRQVAAEIRAEGQRRRSEVSDSGGYGGHYRAIQADECERLARKIEGSTDG